MATSQPVYLRDILIILAAAVGIVPLFRRLRASSVLGYLVAGLVIGPFGLDLIHHVEAAQVLAQFGVVFLLFAIGLELSIERLRALRRYVFGLGTAQLVTTGLVIWAAARGLGLESGAALVLGGGLALSSTAIVLQMLVERHELGTQHGRVAFSVLLLQDLAVVPLLTLVPLLARAGAPVLPALGLALVKGAGLVVIVWVGRLALRPVLRLVARGGAPELFTGIALLLVLGAGWLTESAGLSMALGAFLAGVLIAETEYRPQVVGDIQPFRGILLALFFVTVGMGINPDLARERAPLLLGLLGALLLTKAAALAMLGRAFGLSAAVATSVGLMLAQGGEFGFVLFSFARRAGALSVETEQLAVLVVGLSMLATPLLLLAGRAAGQQLGHSADVGASIAEETRGLRGHVLIAGFGRVGQTLARLLETGRIPYAALDLDPELVTQARSRELPVMYGDASRMEVLKAAGIERARAVVVTLDEPEAAARAVHVARSLLPELPILVRARDAHQCARLELSGATGVVPEVVEGSLQLGGTLLRSLGQPSEQVEQVLGGFRRQAYSQLEGLIESRAPAPRDQPDGRHP